MIIGKRCRSFATQAELPEATRSRVREERAANDPLALRANLSDAGQHKMDDLRPVLAHLNKPLLYIVGERDVAYTEIARDLMRTWADEHKDSLLCGTGFLQIEVMRDVGHNTHLEAPDQFAQVVRAFFDAYGIERSVLCCAMDGLAARRTYATKRATLIQRRSAKEKEKRP